MFSDLNHINKRYIPLEIISNASICFAFRFDTSMGGLTFSDQFLQFSTRLASGAVYGIGETKRLGFKHDMNYKTFGLFARDEPPNVRTLYIDNTTTVCLN